MNKLNIIKRTLFLLTIYLLPGFSVFAQDTLWSRRYGGYYNDAGYSVWQTKDGGYIVAGEWRPGPDDIDIYLIKTNASGDTLWTRTYGGSNQEESYFVQQTTDGGYMVAGYARSFGTGEADVYMIKTDSLGDIQWSRTYGGSVTDELGFSAQQTTDDGYIVVGYTLGVGGKDVYLIKTDSLGDTLWSRSYGTSNNEIGYSVQQTIDGGYIVAGHTFPPAGEGDIYLIKTDSLGDIQWSRNYGGNFSIDATSIQQTTDSGYIVVGYTLGVGEKDVYLSKIDSLGDILWSRTYGGSGFDAGHSIQQTTDGGYIVAGVTKSFGVDSSDVYVIKTDSLGDALWSCTYGGSNHDYGYSVQQTFDGGYIVAGGTQSFGTSDHDVMLTKLDHCGNSCIGEFVSSTVKTVSPTVNSPATIVTSSSTIVTSPPTEVTSVPTEITTACIAVRGDANDDMNIVIGDIIFLINYLFRGGSAPNPLWLGDANCDCQVTLADVIYLINYLFRGGPRPEC